MQPTIETLELAGSKVTFETGRIARQASGAVVVRSGDNVILATVVASSADRGLDFFPLTVEYREKFAAAGMIPGNVMRREGRITDQEVLICRLIDRTIRSLFPKEYTREVQVQVQVMSADPAADLTSLALLGACMALHISEAPAAGPVAGLRIVRENGRWTPFPTQLARARAELEFVVSAGPDGLVMVEGEAKEAPPTRCREALEQALVWLDKVKRTADKLREVAGKPKVSVEAAPTLPELPAEVIRAIEQAVTIAGKAERHQALDQARQTLIASIEDEGMRDDFREAFGKHHSKLVRERILAEGARIDGRGPTDIRPIWSEIGWLPRAHGSAIFTRGETQALVTCTLGTDDDGLRVFELGGERREHFMLHYNFPPYSVGECRPLRGPGRREIGHGNLARRGLAAVVPDFADYPYTLRIESEISESNGSSSMATVCGGCLAMLHAGVPLTRPVAGIAMGLVADAERVAILSDILGDEDHLGDMDFKVVGTREGITALQLDNKIGGLDFDVLSRALDQAVAGIEHILGEMAKTIDAPSAEAPKYAPRVLRSAIMPDSIATLVGPRGTNIRGIQSDTGARVTVGDDGIVHIYAADQATAQKAQRLVGKSVGIVERGKYYSGRVTGVKEFGVFVRINDVTEGLVPNEELRENQRGGKASREEFEQDQEVIVRVIGADDRGRLRLSVRAAIGVDEAQVEF
ncbi:MAG: polyribonucleotide nucleotidyltransferase [Planctomycetes bacterium]|nr:polyribonucleotide nucleotidyltransferase [Planctomycetota bacterium]